MRVPRAVTFLLVGGFGFFVDAGLSLLLGAGLHVPVIPARIPAFIAASLVTFSLNRAFTFRDRPTPFWGGWIRYVLSTSVGAALNIGVYLILTKLYGNGGGIILAGVAFGSAAGLVLNYLCSTLIVFGSVKCLP